MHGGPVNYVLVGGPRDNAFEYCDGVDRQSISIREDTPIRNCEKLVYIIDLSLIRYVLFSRFVMHHHFMAVIQFCNKKMSRAIIINR